MKIAPVAEIKAQFSAYLKAAAAGPVIVTKNGKPIAVLLGMTDEDEIERLILAYSPKFQAVLDAAETRIRTTGGISHDEFWEQVDADFVEGERGSPAEAVVADKGTKKQTRRATTAPRPAATAA